MHIHEYQAKDLFKKNNIKVPSFIVVSNADQTAKACEKLGGSVWVVKAQVHAGGRGKGGGVIVCHNIHDAVDASQKLLRELSVGSNLRSELIWVQKLLRVRSNLFLDVIRSK